MEDVIQTLMLNTSYGFEHLYAPCDVVRRPIAVDIRELV